MKSIVSIALLCVFVLSLTPMSASATDYGKSFGVRAGYGVNPDQFVVGVQSVLGRLEKIAYIAPSFDLGFGDNATVATLNGDLRLLVSPPGSSVFFYGQAGPTLALIDYKDSDSDTEIGLSLSAGMKFPMGKSNHYTLEGRFGIGDIPDFRILFGILLGGGKVNNNK